MNEWRIVAVRDDDERPRRALDDCDRCEHSTWEGRRLEDRGLDRDEHLQINRVIAIGVLKGDALVPDVRGRMRREVRMHRGRVVIVVIRVHVCVQEWCAHGAALNGQRQPEREHAANHVGIVRQNRMSDF